MTDFLLSQGTFNRISSVEGILIAEKYFVFAI